MVRVDAKVLVIRRSFVPGSRYYEFHCVRIIAGSDCVVKGLRLRDPVLCRDSFEPIPRRHALSLIVTIPLLVSDLE